MDIYSQMIKCLKDYGQVITEYVGNHYLAQEGETQLTDQEIYKRDLAWLSTSDFVIAEVTTPSLGVGYEIAMAICKHIPTLCLYCPKKQPHLSAMIAGCPDLVLLPYQTIDEAKEKISNYFELLTTIESAPKDHQIKQSNLLD